MPDHKTVNVVSVAPYPFLPARFGGHKAIAFFYRFFSRKVAFSCVSVKGNENDVFADYPQYRILSSSKLRYINFFSIFKIGKIVKKQQATHIMTEHPYMGWLVLFVRLFYRVKVVIRSHNIEAIRFKTVGKWWWRILYFYEAMIYRKADAVFFITEEDRQFAIKKYHVKEHKTTVVTYGFQPPQTFSSEWKMRMKTFIRKENNLSSDKKVLLFNGDFGYPPNRKALNVLINDILPQLQNKISDFVLIICGKSIPKSLMDKPLPNVITKGFVEDIGAYFAGSDIFLNPIIDGGGIKTKLVEALSYETLSVSFESGAIGIPLDVTEGTLVVAADGDVNGFVDAIVSQLNNNSEWKGEKFNQYFNWERIAQHAADFLATT